MIFKIFEINKINFNKEKFYLFYGENEGYKNEIIKEKFKKFKKEQIYRYEEVEILDNKTNFFNSIFSKSFFENEKLIIISRTTDKILEIIKEIKNKDLEDVIVILNAKILEK